MCVFFSLSLSLSLKEERAGSPLMGRDCVDGRERKRQRNKLLKEKKNKSGGIKIKLLKNDDDDECATESLVTFAF